MPTDTRLNLTPQFVMGVCLVLFGALLTLDRLQVVDAAVSFRFWPVALVALPPTGPSSRLAERDMGG